MDFFCSGSCWFSNGFYFDGQAQAVFEGYAEQLDLNVEQFKSDYASKEVADRINRDVNNAASLDITATPSFLVNGKKIESPASQPEYETMLNDAIKAAGGTPPVKSETTTPAQ